MSRPRVVLAIIAVGDRDSRASDKALSSTLETELESSGFDVSVAGDGDRALELCRELDPDVVIAEILLPGLNGYQLCRQLRIEKPRLPTLLFSSRHDPADMHWADVVGARRLLRKPGELEEAASLAAELVSASP